MINTTILNSFIVMVNNMEKRINCSYFGTSCGWSARSSSETALIREFAQHITEHGFNDIPEEWQPKIKSAIQEV